MDIDNFSSYLATKVTFAGFFEDEFADADEGGNERDDAFIHSESPG